MSVVEESLKSQKGSLDRAVKYLVKSRDQLKGSIDGVSQDVGDIQALIPLSAQLKVLHQNVENVNTLLSKFEQLAAGAGIEQYQTDQEAWADLVFECQNLAAEAENLHERAQSSGQNRRSETGVITNGGSQTNNDLADQISRLVTAMERQSAPVFPTNNVGQSSGNQSLFSKLPKMELAKFEGDILKWKPFWDRFKNSVDKNHGLAPVGKLTYLVGYLEKEPLELIESLPVTDDNYEVAKGLLVSKYGDTKMVVALLYRRLNEMAPVKNEPVALRRFVADIECLLGSLGALGQNVSDDNFATIILSKLPQDVVVLLEMDKHVDAAWTVDLVREKLKTYLVRLERASKVSSAPTNKKPWNRSDFTADSLHASDSPGGKKGRVVDKGSKNGWKGSPPNKSCERKSEPEKRACVYCQGSHFSDQCEKFTKADDRYKQLRGRCSICLSDQHKKRAYNSQKPCHHCKMVRNHHRSLCFKMFGRNADQAHVADSNDTEKSTEDQSTDSGLLAVGEEVLLQTGLIPIRCGKSTSKTFETHRALFDPGSNRSYCSEALANKLRLKLETGPMLTVNRFGSDQPVRMPTKMGLLQVRTLDGRMVKIAVSVIQRITGQLVRVPVAAEQLKEAQMKGPLADQVASGYQSNPIDLLVGSDYYLDFITGEKIHLRSGLYLLGSRFGYMLTGRQSAKLSCDHDMSMCGFTGPGLVFGVDLEPNPNHERCQSKEPDVANFWSLESLGIRDDPKATEDDLAIGKFQESVRLENGRYSVGLPWNERAHELGSNYGLCLGRLKSLLRKLQPHQDLFQQYSDIIAEQLAKEVIELVDDVETGPKGHYIPHHAVVNAARESTKVRIVYDGSAKVGKMVPSLNEALYRGPIILEDIAGVLLRFRTHKVGLIADIEKAFLQIKINVPDRDSLRFLWLKDPSKGVTDGNIQTYRFCRVPFGLNCSPSLLAQTLQFHLRMADNPTATTIMNDLYVDNVITGVDSVEAAAPFYHQAKELFKGAAMNLRQWSSNCQEFVQSVSEVDRAKSLSPKVLGLKWDTGSDTLSSLVVQKLDCLANQSKN